MKAWGHFWEGGSLFERQIDCSIFDLCLPNASPQFFAHYFRRNFPVLPPFFAFYLSQDCWQGIILEEAGEDALVRTGRYVARRFLKAARP